ncbi:MAG: hypothetical protein RMY28_035760 [Nostoc sp. ChiSLP01]|nr:hypothetical protein [Nostoc sp. CmiSLP01]MDZ8284829.1 hypothetical protein [Nostoc sp. ChiSLP01]
MHKISPQAGQQAIEHSKTSLRHGKIVEEIGHRLENSDPSEQEHGQFLIEHGKNIQQYAQESLDKAQRLTEDGSTEVFTEVLQAHIDATQNYIESVSEFQKGLEAHLHQQKNYSREQA